MPAEGRSPSPGAVRVGWAREKEQQRWSREFLPPCLHLWLAPIHTFSPVSGLALGNTVLATAKAQLHPQEDVEIFNIRSLAEVCFTRWFFKGNLFLKLQARNLSPGARDDGFPELCHGCMQTGCSAQGATQENQRTPPVIAKSAQPHEPEAGHSELKQSNPLASNPSSAFREQTRTEPHPAVTPLSSHRAKPKSSLAPPEMGSSRGSGWAVPVPPLARLTACSEEPLHFCQLLLTLVLTWQRFY